MQIHYTNSVFSIRHLLGAGKLQVSFEFFPPKSEEMDEKLWEAITKLAPVEPSFVSVTYGAGGTTRERTHATIQRILKETTLKPAAHLTCVNATREEIDAIAQEYWDMGVRHIVALRGDAPGGDGIYRPTPGGYAYASDLVEGLKRIADFEISVAAYPELHPEAVSAEADMDYLKRKVDAGATRAITQYFFNVEDFLRFQERAVKAGINVPIVPGILPVNNVAQVLRFSKMCGAKVPGWLTSMFEGLDDDPMTRNLVAATVAAEMCRLLYANGVHNIHFYTLNRAELVYAICHMLGLRANCRSSEALEEGQRESG